MNSASLAHGPDGAASAPTGATQGPQRTRPDSAAPAARPQPLGFVGGDRPCVSCGFNLRGQAIAREPHYGLPMARCPECGRADALMELPRLARWQKRVALWLTLAWLGTLLLGLLVTFGTISGATNSIRYVMAEPLKDRILDAYKASFTTDSQLSFALSENLLGAGWENLIDAQAIAHQTPNPLLSPTTATLIELLLTPIYIVPLGVCWGVALGWRPRVQVLAIMLAMTLACITFYHLFFESVGSGLSRIGLQPAINVAVALLGPKLYITPGLVLAASLMLGAWFGKPVARRLVLLLIPPAARAPLSFLWYVDGLPMPAAGLVGSGSAGATSAARSS